jgi:hypothetical protein
MARQKKTTKGKCHLCNEVFDKAVMTRHLTKCRKDHEGQAKASPGKRTHAGTVFHLIVEGRYLPEYWMRLEVSTQATLEQLDQFLRDTWLECCGHLSAFTIAGEDYTSSSMDVFDDEDDEPDDNDMDVKLDDVLSPGMKFEHQYDFGTTTYLTLKVVSQLDSDRARTKIQILARNEPPAIACVACGQPATQVCTQCLYEGKGWLCEKCVPTHRCDEELLLPVVNSPRVGQCGYTG